MRAVPVVLSLALCACKYGFSSVDADVDAVADANDYDEPGVVQIGSQGGHICVRTGTGVVRCWGRNEYGQIGIGTTSAMEGLRTVSGMPPIATMAVSEFGVYAVDRDGGLWVWGLNTEGQLGIGTQSAAQTAPKRLEDLEPIRSVAASQVATCATARSGQLYCWGLNTCGQQGDNSASTTSPRPIVGLTNFGTIAMDDTLTCGVDATSALRCWGDEGHEPTECLSISPPGSVMNVPNARLVAAGCHENRCVVDTDGVAWCWGLGNDGALGDGSTSGARSDTPVRVAVIDGITAIGTAYTTSCAATDANRVYCWGSNALGTAGLPMTTTEAYAPVEVDEFNDGVRPIDQITSGCETICLLTNHQVYCWGGNDAGQVLGAPETPAAFLPRLITTE